MEEADRFSIACFYNLKSAHPVQGHPPNPYSRSPVSPIQTPSEDSPLEATRNMASESPIEQHMYYDEKIVMVEPVGYGMQAVGPSPNRRPSHAPEVVEDTPHRPPPVPPLPITVPTAIYTQVPINLSPPGYTDLELPSRPQQKPFWKRHILWIAAVLALGILIIGVVVGVVGHSENKQRPATDTTAGSAISRIANNTRSSVASTGFFLNDNKTWNTHVLWQNAAGAINLQVSLDGVMFQPEQDVRLSIPPKLGSPLSATSQVEPTTGIVMLNIFYLTGINNITMSTLTCAPMSDRCTTVFNGGLPTLIAPSNFTGLAAVNVNDAPDWRIYYQDEKNNISELQGNAGGFDMGKTIGGQAMNASSIAAVNINSTTNNIHVFYVDGLTQTLFKTQFTDGAWTRPSIVSTALVEQWNPKSGLGASYTEVQDQLHVYYTGLDAGIYEYLGSGASNGLAAKWALQPGHNHLWHTADFVGAPISAVGWKDQGRFYQVKDGNLAEGHLNGTIWTEAFISRNGTFN